VRLIQIHHGPDESRTWRDQDGIFIADRSPPGNVTVAESLVIQLQSPGNGACMPPSALKLVSDDLRNLQGFVAGTAPPASGGQARQKKRPRLECGQYCPLEIGHRVSRCPKGMLSRASNLVYGRSQRRSPGGLPLPATTIFSINWRAGVSPRPAARNEIERPTKSGRNTSPVMRSCQFGVDREDLHLPLACICTRWIGGGGLINVITADGTRREPPLLTKVKVDRSCPF
jgi:hypothetical protein